MAKPKVYVTRRIPDAGLNMVIENCDAKVWPDLLPPPYEVIKQEVADCEGLLCLLTDRVDAELMDAAPKLKVISNYAVGYDNIDVAAATARGIKVGNTPGVLTDATADFAFSLLCAAARRIVEAAEYAKAGHWKTWEPRGHLGQDIWGATIGIIGMGRIGYRVAYSAHHGFKMRVLYYDVRPNEQAERELGAQKVDLDTLLAQSDFVSIHTDLNPTTRGMIGPDEFEKMKPNAILINTARGPIVQTEALYQALKSGKIWAAALDVTDPEPLPPDHPLYQLPNCIIAPHIASATYTSRNKMAVMAAENLLAGLRGEKLPNQVNPEVE
ncbi:MAG: D-glycerate dehydrogenase [Armatimonadetes bacterium]|nr:D-glycerate dehydrogenase [Armatimonadota bacterium]